MDTRTIIMNSFIKLIKEYSFDHITIQMILDDAKISRSTFYRYYCDKYDLMHGYYKQFTRQLQQFYGYSHYVDLVTDTFVFVKKNNTYFKKVSKVSGQHCWVNFITEYSMEYYLDIYKKATGKEASRKEKMQMFLVSTGAGAVLKKWVLEGCPDNPRDLAEWIYEMLPDSVTKIIDSNTENIN